MNKKGFTLTELIATIVILGILMTVAIPNVLSIIERNKALNMIEDAKKFITEVEYLVKRDTTIELPANYEGTVISLKYLKSKTNSNLDDSPYNIKYNDNSFVLIAKKAGSYTYYATLTAIETKPGTNQIKSNSRGIKLQNMANLNSKDYSEIILRDSAASMVLPSINTKLLSNSVTITKVYN